VREAGQRIGVEADEAHQSLRALERGGRRGAEIHRTLDYRGADRAARIEQPVRILKNDLYPREEHILVSALPRRAALFEALLAELGS
jgi:hypothetical protein